MKQSVATAISIAAMMGLTVSAQAVAGTATGSASVTIVEPLSVTEVSSFSFIHTNTINAVEHGDESSSLIVSNSPREKPITAISHSSGANLPFQVRITHKYPFLLLRIHHVTSNFLKKKRWWVMCQLKWVVRNMNQSIFQLPKNYRFIQR